MITRSYNDQPMIGLTADDYDTLVHHLHEQVMACVGRDSYPEDDAEKRVSDVLANEWSDEITVREWLRRVGEALRIDTSRCVGA